VHYSREVASLSRDDEQWSLHFTQGAPARHASVVLANGHHISQFTQTESLPLYPVGGQVSHIPAASELSKLRQVLCYDGYLTPQNRLTGITALVPATIVVRRRCTTAKKTSDRIANA
jgi:tRNA 5-methylaminomethyl-2-thiouridine biosynthesis bifunctional protein